MKNLHTSGKRKTAIARATLRQGSGIVRINKIPVNLIGQKTSMLKLLEPLILAVMLLARLILTLMFQAAE